LTRAQRYGGQHKDAGGQSVAAGVRKLPKKENEGRRSPGTGNGEKKRDEAAKTIHKKLNNSGPPTCKTTASHLKNMLINGRKRGEKI